MKTANETFDADYYRSHCGSLPYLRTTPEWHSFFRPIADAIVLGLAPRKTFDAGCAVGFLVEMLWDRGVEAHGRDVSEFAISQIRADVRPWCEIGSIADPIEGQYDVVLCIEVLEHMPAEEAVAAIRNITSVAPRVLFSSSPIDLEEVTHINVRPTRYWLERFAEVGFAPAVGFDATFLCPHAMLLERSDEGRDERSLAAFTEIVRQRLKVAEARQAEARTCDALRQELAAAKQAEAEARAQAKQADERALAAQHAEEAAWAAKQAEETALAAEKQAEERALAAAKQAEESALAAKQAAEAAWAAKRAEESARSQLEKQVAALSLRETEARATAHREIQHGAQRASQQRAAEERARIAESHLRFMAQSKAWRVARTLQRTSTRLPLLRRAVKLVWWTCTLQLPRQRRLRRANIETMEVIRQTGLFDDAYYRANTPDLAVSGMDGALHFHLFGWKEGRKPSAGFDPAFYLDQNPDVAAAGVNPLLHYVQHGRAKGRQPLPSGSAPGPERPPTDPTAVPVAQHPPSVRSMVRAHCASWAPLPVFADRRATPTLTILTDSVDANHLFGGVGTALVIGALAARRLDARLRLVTRHQPPDPTALGEILQAHRVDWRGAMDIVHMPVGDDRPLPLGDKDVVLTTSWWSTRAALGSVNAARILCLLQEDERMFYPFGDSRLRCAETLSEPDLRLLVNTSLLFDHLADGPDPLPRLRERGHWFEPAFPAFPRPKTVRSRKGKQNFFFYARPNNDRNLYWRGLEVIDAVMREGLLPPSEWDIHFVGRELPDMVLPGGVRPIVWAKLPWSKYAELVAQMDLGLCLMDTPHPSYPPLDLAASGAVVVTNTHGPKTSLHRWSRNILAAPPTIAALVAALRRAVPLAHDTAQRMKNCTADHIPRDWEPELNSVLDRILTERTR